MAARSLLPGNLPPFRDALAPTWTATHVFTVAVDFGADLKKINAAFDRWFSKRRTEYEKQHRCTSPSAVAKRLPRPNVGRGAAPRREALSWLGAFRFHQAGITFPKAMKEVDRRQREVADPRAKKFPRLANVLAMVSGDWSTWKKKATKVMLGMFKPRAFPPPNDKLPSPRWPPKGPIY